jgi:hypothetical protein
VQGSLKSIHGYRKALKTQNWPSCRPKIFLTSAPVASVVAA